MKKILYYTIFCIAVALSYMPSIDTVYASNAKVIAELDRQLAKATLPVEKSNINMYKARNYAVLGQYKKAVECYDNALRLNHKGWIHLERAKFFLSHKKYSLAESEALTAKEETSTLQYQADPIIKKAQKELEKIYLRENPPTIVFDTKADSHRKSRFDYIKANDTNAAVSEYSKQLSKSRVKAKKAAMAKPRTRVRRS